MDSPNTYEIAPPADVRGRHVRAARTLLDWTKARAAQECGVGVNTIGRFEEGYETLTPRTVGDIVRTFEANGVIFVRADVGAGVFLRSTLDGE
ncbi:MULTISPECIES: helix-turn-helix transcriptional regulator [unclassified Bacteria]|uniref:helix-turn-helix domain-containing protein n=1 Tax=Mesorhizobium sp. TaxID=1871066 RepID=UPI000FE520AA|nr:MAG: XRE family transcriptional regulator [Mesorhizobium sp.]TGQ62665.1 XRE family transcriptional regulator [bacterium M00.F.Ca.ET.205.01.1.1]TGU45689.1 XRE family transcriptional regulator [bacterium M00.F.Ca.ET.152.01.1.1]TGV31490.1 XRE family transcriptional regulator [Mesorhizobium sp. M00.F.Ca.ET.186.01.1.1]TGZ38698.1 XRE family transcriptional regulator [bacterium M00.F.Ca.ET.162.01.1.1]